MRSLEGVPLDDQTFSALLEHSKHSLEAANFDQGPFPTSGAIPQHSFQDFPKLANIRIATKQLVDMYTYQPSKIRYTPHDRIDGEESVFGNTDWIDLITFLPP